MKYFEQNPSKKPVTKLTLSGVVAVKTIDQLPVDKHPPTADQSAESWQDLLREAYSKGYVLTGQFLQPVGNQMVPMFVFSKMPEVKETQPKVTKSQPKVEKVEPKVTKAKVK